MALSRKFGTFLARTTLAATVTVAGVGFEPDVVFVWSGGNTSATDAGGSGNPRGACFGVFTSSTSRYCVGNDWVDAAATMNTSRGNHDAAFWVTVRDNLVDGALDIVSMDADGFTYIVDDALPAAPRIHYLAIAGLDNVDIRTITEPAATGNQGTTGVGFQPDAVMFLSTSAAVPAAGSRANMSIGIATSSSNQYVMATSSDDNNPDAVNKSYSISGECIALTNTSSATDALATFVSMDADGFTVNWTQRAGTTREVICVSMKGGEWLAGTLQTRTDGNDIVEGSFGFQPLGGLFFSQCKAFDASDTPSAHIITSIGGFTSATERGAMGWAAEDAVAAEESATAVDYDQVYVSLGTGDAVEAAMDIKSVDSGGFTAVMDTVEPVSAKDVFYLVFGDTAAGSNMTLGAVTGVGTATVTMAAKRALTLATAAGLAVATVTVQNANTLKPATLGSVTGVGVATVSVGNLRPATAGLPEGTSTATVNFVRQHPFAITGTGVGSASVLVAKLNVSAFPQANGTSTATVTMVALHYPTMQADGTSSATVTLESTAQEEETTTSGGGSAGRVTPRSQAPAWLVKGRTVVDLDRPKKRRIPKAEVVEAPPPPPPPLPLVQLPPLPPNVIVAPAPIEEPSYESAESVLNGSQQFIRDAYRKIAEQQKDDEEAIEAILKLIQELY